MKTVGIWGLFSGRGSGIGRMLAEYLLSDKYQVIGIGRNPSDNIIHGLKKTIAIDIENEIPDQETIRSRVGEIDALVITAGVGFPHPIWDIDLPKIRQMADANFVLPVWIFSALKDITQHFVITGSIAGIVPREGSSVYAGSKAAVVAFAESARKELPKHNIQTINFNYIHRIGADKILNAYRFMIDNPANIDITINV